MESKVDPLEAALKVIGIVESCSHDLKVIGLAEIVARAYLERHKPIPNAVNQTTPTNCFAACVATILGINIERVPKWCDGEHWEWDKFQEWLEQFGLAAIELTFANGGTIYPAYGVPCIVSGPSPRMEGKLHAIVGRFNGLDGFTCEHDPHVDELWIDGEPTHCAVFVLIDPAKWVKSLDSKRELGKCVNVGKTESEAVSK